MTYTTAEIQANKDVWIYSLRNDGLAQAEGKLANADYSAFCCIGVAAEKVPALGCTRGAIGGYLYTLLDAIFEDDMVAEANTEVQLDSDLPGEVMAKMGLTSEMQTFLITLNDDAKLNFGQIADVIEEMPIIGASDGPDLTWDRFQFLRRNMDLFRHASSEWLFNELYTAVTRLGMETARV